MGPLKECAVDEGERERERGGLGENNNSKVIDSESDRI